MCMRLNCPRPPAAGRTNPRFFTQIYAEKIRRLVRRGGFFVLGTKPLRLRFFARHNFSNELISSIRSAAVRREGFFVLRGFTRKKHRD
jgi:hypothetical protein